MPTGQEKTVALLQETHAMEQSVLRMLDSMITTTDDEQILADLKHHKGETEGHESRLRERLEELGEGTSMFKEASGVLGAITKGFADAARSDKPLRNARDGFMTEHMEIAAYELLERVARRAGDTETAAIAAQNRADEEAMAEKIASSWDHVVDVEFAEEQVTA